MLLALLAGCGIGKPRLITDTGRLADCDWSRCVSSRAPDPRHFVEPIRYEGSRESARDALIRVIGAMDGASVVTQTPDYVHAEFTTAYLRFVDDVELDFAQEVRAVHVISSSRIGVYDFKRNRERIEEIRARFEALQP